MDVDRQAGLTAATDLLRALASEHRLAIVQELSSGPRCVHELVEALGVSQSLVSQHLRVLRGSRIVRGQRRGREIAYSLPDEHIAHIVADAIVHAAEPGTAEPGTAEPHAAEPDAAEPHAAEPHAAEPHAAEPRS